MRKRKVLGVEEMTFVASSPCRTVTSTAQRSPRRCSTGCSTRSSALAGCCPVQRLEEAEAQLAGQLRDCDLKMVELKAKKERRKAESPPPKPVLLENTGASLSSY